MKRFSAITAAFLLLYILSGCTCQHTWQETTCGRPKTCSLCNATEGEPQEHTWDAATCESPQICTVCGVTDGNALGHTYGLPYPLTLSQCYVCKVCHHRETTPLSEESYTADVKQVLQGNWTFDDAGEDYPLPPHTMKGLCFTFSGTDATLCIGETPIVSFPLKILDYNGWTLRSAEESLEGVSADLDVPPSEDTLFFDDKLLSITQIKLSEEITTLNSIPFLEVQMVVDGQPVYSTFIKNQPAAVSDTFLEDLNSMMNGDWLCYFDDIPHSFSPDTLKRLTLSISGQEATLFYDGSPFYVFQWEVDVIIPWDASSYAPGYTVLLSVSFRENPLILEEIPFYIENITLDLEENQDISAGIGLSVFISIDGAQEYLYFLPCP